MRQEERELKTLLTEQDFEPQPAQQAFVETMQQQARAYAQATDGIAVLSDLQNGVCHIHSGQFGRSMGFAPYVSDTSTAFENTIFGSIYEEELMERHILELRFFRFIESVALSAKMHHCAMCLVHFLMPDGRRQPVLHTMRYVGFHPNGSMWLGLCTYIPFPQATAQLEGCIIDTRTGQRVQPEQYVALDSQLLSRRQLEVLTLLAQGLASKQVADRLNISVHTVNRHRQDILATLGVSNSAAAVDMGRRMHII